MNALSIPTIGMQENSMQNMHTMQSMFISLQVFKNNIPLPHVFITLDGQVVQTNANGIASFDMITLGEHKILTLYNKERLEQSVTINGPITRVDYPNGRPLTQTYLLKEQNTPLFRIFHDPTTTATFLIIIAFVVGVVVYGISRKKK
jgi:hypothetical protein